DGWTHPSTLRRRDLPVDQGRTAVRADLTRPRQLFDERPGLEERARDAIEHVEEAVAIRLQQELARPPLPLHVDEDGLLLRIPVPEIVRSELEVPLECSGRRLERENRVGVEVVSLSLVAVV